MGKLLETRFGAAFGLGLIVACFVPIAMFLLNQLNVLQKQQSAFEAVEMREAFVALSDLQRVNLLVLRAINEGLMTRETASELEAAVDFLFVRNESFRKRVVDGVGSSTTAAALTHMENVIALVDTSRNDGYRDLRGLFDRLIVETDEARRLLFVFLDERRRRHDVFIVEQQEQIERQSVLLLGFVLSLTVAGGAAFLFFRREVRMRRQFETANERAQFLAYYDPLTRLPNRVLFRERVEAIIASGSPLTMVFADMDRFKSINDSMGHAMGDAVLQFVAGHLAHTAGEEGGISARLSGDEFAMAIPTADHDRLRRMAESLIAACAQAVTLDGESVVPGVSMGAAVAEGSGAGQISYDVLLRRADFALYASKSNGRGQFTIFDEALETQFNERRRLMSEVPLAIRSGGIEVFLQPKFVVETRSVYGFEALARWRRGGAIVPSDEFIELAESSGAIIELDLFVLRKATRIVADWNAARNTEVSVSANLSTAHFRREDLVDQVADALRDSGLSPHLLTLEITETVQILNWDQVGVALSKLRDLGCRIAIDDFGAGYSSLAYLRTIGADELKIDRSLVSEITTSEEARFILDTVIDLAHSLRMDVVVEGVETESQLEKIRALGCRRAQGFIVSQPIPAAEALATFADASPAGAPVRTI